ncbi:MAG: response regulator [Sphaerochaetaceae bacterium]|nr:response regulator [Sphaerochaetaceae bacterium]
MTQKVLIVEDEPAMALAIEFALNRSGFDVVGNVTSCDAAIETAHKACPDMILMDVRLDGEGDGVIAAEQIRMFAPLTPIIFMTANSDRFTVERMDRIPRTDRVDKPFELTTLIDKLREL